jgi:hypothetical protein
VTPSGRLCYESRIGRRSRRQQKPNGGVGPKVGHHGCGMGGRRGSLERTVTRGSSSASGRHWAKKEKRIESYASPAHAESHAETIAVGAALWRASPAPAQGGPLGGGRESGLALGLALLRPGRGRVTWTGSMGWMEGVEDFVFASSSTGLTVARGGSIRGS